MAEVSAIIYSKNSADNLDALLLSVFVQSVQDVEIIIVDNASDEKTLKLLDNYALFDKRIKLIKNKENSTFTDCLKLGAEKSSAPYVIFLDATRHTYLAQSCLEQQLLNISKNKSDFVYMPCGVYDANTFKPTTIYQINPEDFVQTPVFAADDLPEKLVFRMHLSPWAKLFKRKFLQKISYIPYEEPFFLECLFKAERISFDLNSLYAHQAEVKDLRRPNVFEELQENKNVLVKFGEWERLKNPYIYHKMRNIWLEIIRAPMEEKPQIFEKMKAEFSKEDFSQYDFDFLRKEDLYWAIQNAIKLKWGDFKKLYIGGAE